MKRSQTLPRAWKPAAVPYLLFGLALFGSVAAAEVDVSRLSGMKARCIGPAGMSGRVTSIAVRPGDETTIYVGTANGGVWKSLNAGITWQPLFDNQPVASIGAVAPDPANPDVIWVGTGEGNPRNSVSVGNGVYRSKDGGVTWDHLGLENTQHIHRVLVHPQRGDVVFVAALGSPWEPNEERGIFKTTDGGKTWRKILYINARTGGADLVMDPRNPDKLIAALWESRRQPWFFRSGGSGSGIYVSHDGGESWNRRTEESGLPGGELGRIGLAFAPGNPIVVYALVEADRSALLRSEDGGIKWDVVNQSDGINPRPFYYADLRVDPANENRLYSLTSQLRLSEDGGKSFRSIVESSRVHGDYHALWINPLDSSHLICGNDGGLAISRDRGETWRFIENLPLAQFYHIAVDQQEPYNVYGGMQDNGSWRGPSQVWRSRGIFNWYWDRVGSGDGFEVLPDATQPERYGYSMAQGGSLRRYDLHTGERQPIRPVHPRGLPLRFSWNAALAADPFHPAAIYFGSQFLHRSTDRGNSWQIISPDLTTNDPKKQRQLDSGGLTFDVTGAENHTTIVSIAPSSREEGVIWVGTDDGNVQLTRNGGESWKNLTAAIPNAPVNGWVAHIEASYHKASSAFVVFDNHRNGDLRPYVYLTEDFGQTWRELAKDQVSGYALVIEQDPVEARLLFLGTEFGLYFSLDTGSSWQKWTSGFPTTSTMDLVIHPVQHDLVVGTHGRAAYILDDIGPLRALAQQPGLLDEVLHLFEVTPAVQYAVGEPGGLRAPGDAVFQGENRPYGALLTYVFNPEPEIQEESPSSDSGAMSDPTESAAAAIVRIEILNPDGELIRTLEQHPRPGVNRTQWDLRRKGFRFPSRRAGTEREPVGFPVLPGTYTVRIYAADQEQSRTVRVRPDPRLATDAEERQAKDTAVRRLSSLVETANRTLSQIQEAKKGTELVRERTKEGTGGDTEALTRSTTRIRESLDRLEEKILGRRVQGIRRDPEILVSKLRDAWSSLGRSWSAPTRQQILLIQKAEEALSELLEQWNRFQSEQWEAYVQEVEAAGIRLLERTLE